MPNVNAVINEQIRRLARREIRSNTKSIKKATGHYRRDIAALKRQMAQLLKLVGTLQKQMPSQPPTAPAEVVQKARLRIDGLKAHRAKLALSAKDYGRLMGVSGLTIYNWEAGKTKPRRSQLPRIVAVRGIGKRDAMQRLGMEKPVRGRPSKAAMRTSHRRGAFKQTAEAFVLSLLQSQKATKTNEINAAWKKAGRSGNADNTLSQMTKAKKLKRMKVKGVRGSEYRAP